MLQSCRRPTVRDTDSVSHGNCKPARSTPGASLPCVPPLRESQTSTDGRSTEGCERIVSVSLPSNAPPIGRLRGVHQTMPTTTRGKRVACIPEIGCEGRARVVIGSASPAPGFELERGRREGVGLAKVESTTLASRKAARPQPSELSCASRPSKGPLCLPELFREYPPVENPSVPSAPSGRSAHQGLPRAERII